MFVGKRADLLALDRDVAEESLVFKKRHDKDRARATKIDLRSCVNLTGRVGLVRHHVQDMEGTPGFDHPSDWATGLRFRWIFLSEGRVMPRGHPSGPQNGN